MRYRPYFLDGSGAETCAVNDMDKFSYRVFEFMDLNAGNLPGDGQDQHITCSIKDRLRKSEK
jgi:hypothetical protein